DWSSAPLLRVTSRPAWRRPVMAARTVCGSQPSRCPISATEVPSGRSASTMNGDDGWPDVLARRLHAIYGNKIAVVNAGIGGNQVVGPAEYSPQKPYPGGPSARDRLDRDVLSLSGIAAVVWLEGINAFS